MADNRPQYKFGDILLSITENGSDITLTEDGFLCDPTLNMSAMISVFTHNGWFGNALLDTDIGCDIDNITEVSINGRKELENIINSSLQYLVNENFLQSVSVQTQIVSKTEYQNVLTFTNFEGEEKTMYWKWVV